MRYKPNLKLKPLSVAQCAYLAGMIDGEGSIVITKRNGGPRNSRTGYCYRPVLHVASTHGQVLKVLQRWTGLGRAWMFDDVRENRKARWQWMAWSNQAAQIVAAVQPYLIIKRRQAATFLRFVEEKRKTRSPGVRGLTNQQWRTQDRFYAKMKMLNA